MQIETRSFAHFLEYVLLFLTITWINNVNNFQIAKVQPQGIAWHLLDFLSISAWCCLLKVLLIKKACNTKAVFAPLR